MNHARSVYVIAAALIALGLSAVVFSIPESVVARLDLWRPNSRVVKRLESHEKRRLKKLPASEEFEALASALMDANLAASPISGLSPIRQQQLNKLLLKQVREFLKKHGGWPYAGVGAFLASRFQQRLEILAGRMATASEPLSEWLSLHEADKDVREVRALSGRFLERAVGSGLLVAGKGPEPDLMLVARTMWLENWLAMGRRFEENLHLSRDEWALLLKWKIEDAQHLELDRKLAHIETLLRFEPGYPQHLARGVLMVQAGFPEDAVREFRESLIRKERPRVAGDWLVFLRGLDQADMSDMEP